MSKYVSVELQKQIHQQFNNCCAYCQTAESLRIDLEMIDPFQIFLDDIDRVGERSRTPPP
jgi:hypothetical protein